jgi:hypothetical protein
MEHIFNKTKAKNFPNLEKESSKCMKLSEQQTGKTTKNLTKG